MKLESSLLAVLLWASFASGFSQRQSLHLPNHHHHHHHNPIPTSFSSNNMISPRPTVSATTLALGHFSQREGDGVLQLRRPLATTSFALFRVPRGGGAGTTKVNGASTPMDTGTKCPATGFATVAASVWGTTGVLYILAKAIKRVLPIALEPFQGAAGARALSQFELGAYIVTCLWFAYVEGYKGFQQKFSPLVVKRSFTLIPGRNGTKWYHYLLAPFYSMGLLHATKKRQIVSWSVSLGIAAIVAAVKRLPYPWRNIVDAGVVVGLTWGSLSILVLYAKSWITGQAPQDVDACLPKQEAIQAKNE